MGGGFSLWQYDPNSQAAPQIFRTSYRVRSYSDLVSKRYSVAFAQSIRFERFHSADIDSFCEMSLPNDEALQKRLGKLRIRDEDLEEEFIRGSGPGGQKINKTSSTVVLRHLPSGVEVRCQRERSQVMNRYWARMELCDRLEAVRAEAKLALQNEREKTRRQNRPRPRGLKQRILDTKKNRSGVKKNRGRVKGED